MGINVVPCEHDGRLVVEVIDPEGKAGRLTNLVVGDEIIAINGASLIARFDFQHTFSKLCHLIKLFFSSFMQTQETFKKALKSPELRLKVLKVNAAVNEEMAVDGDSADDDNKENRAYLKEQPTSTTSSRLG